MNALQYPDKQVLFDEVGPDGGEYKIGEWQRVPGIVHDEGHINGFFGPYRWLSNFGDAAVSLDGVWYSSVELAYQAGKWPVDERDFFVTCTNKEAIAFNREHQMGPEEYRIWLEKRVNTMRMLLLQKYDPELNPDNNARLIATGARHLQETNWWGDTFWGTDLEGNGQNTLGKLLMEVRASLMEVHNGD